MSFTSIMVSVDHTQGSAHRTRLARSLSERFDARLIGVGARLVALPPMVVGSDLPMIYPDLEREATEDIEKAKLAFMSRVAGSNRAEWRGHIDDPMRYLAEQSRASDLIVVPREAHGDAVDRHFGVNAGDVVMAVGRPVLVAPPMVEDVEGKRILVAWKDTCEARRAVRDALPFLRAAETVLIVEVTDEVLSPHSVKDVARYLEGHGIEATAINIVAHGRTAEEILMEKACYIGADLIVAGAYGHRRLREAVFGGVTRSLLKGSNICCLMSH